MVWNTTDDKYKFFINDFRDKFKNYLSLTSAGDWRKNVYGNYDCIFQNVEFFDYDLDIKLKIEKYLKENYNANIEFEYEYNYGHIEIFKLNVFNINESMLVMKMDFLDERLINNYKEFIFENIDENIANQIIKRLDKDLISSNIGDFDTQYFVRKNKFFIKYTFDPHEILNFDELSLKIKKWFFENYAIKNIKVTLQKGAYDWMLRVKAEGFEKFMIVANHDFDLFED